MEDEQLLPPASAGESVGEMAHAVWLRSVPPVAEVREAEAAFESAVGYLGNAAAGGSEYGVHLQEAMQHAGRADGHLVAAQEGLVSYVAGVSGEPPVYLEPREFGGVTYAVALSAHDEQGVPAMSEAIKDCDVIAIESSGGGVAASRAQTEDMYTLLLQQGVDPDFIRKQFELLKQADPSVIPRILERFIGSGKEVVFIDTPNDHPIYEEAQKYSAARNAVKMMLDNVAPVPVMRRFVDLMNQIGAESGFERDAVMGNQLRGLAAQFPPGTNIGVIVGKQHYRILDALDPTPDSSSLEDVRDKVYCHSLTARIHIDHIETGEISPHLTDRLMVALYLARYTGRDLDVAEALVQVMRPDQVAATLTAVDRVAGSTMDVKARKAAMTADLTGLVKQWGLEGRVQPVSRQ